MEKKIILLSMLSIVYAQADFITDLNSLAGYAMAKHDVLSGYVDCKGSLFKGERNNVNLQLLINRPMFVATGVNLKELLAANYKIHLMPKNQEQFEKIITSLVKELKNNNDFAKFIHSFKFAYGVPFDMKKDDLIKKLRNDRGENMAIIAINLASGKDNAQKALNQIRKLFEREDGLDVMPRYNQRVTSLIFFAQGDGGEKYDVFSQYYENPERIYYSEMFEGVKKDYKLKI